MKAKPKPDTIASLKRKVRKLEREVDKQKQLRCLYVQRFIQENGEKLRYFRRSEEAEYQLMQAQAALHTANCAWISLNSELLRLRTDNARTEV